MSAKANSTCIETIPPGLKLMPSELLHNMIMYIVVLIIPCSYRLLTECLSDKIRGAARILETGEQSIIYINAQSARKFLSTGTHIHS